MGTKTISYSFAQDTAHYSPVISFLFKTIEQRLSVSFEQKNDNVEVEIVFGENYLLKKEIYDAFLINQPCEPKFVKGIHVYFDEKGRHQDVLGSIFYILNCLGEEENMVESTDSYGRLNFRDSIYSRHHNSFTDLVTPLMRLFLKNYAGMDFVDSNMNREVVLTHDIDFLNSGFRQEFFYFLKNPGFKLAFSLLRHLFTKKKLWSNIAEIIKLEKKFDAGSIFYFIPKSGENRGIQNADYTNGQSRIVINDVNKNGMEYGLHKSSFQSTHSEELALLGQTVLSNRNHYLLYKYPQSWREISASGISIDTGLGWSDQPGLRNGYPSDFMPYGTQLIIVPLVIMDTTFDNYRKGQSLLEVFKEMEKEWVDGYCVSILFHNNYLTPWSNRFFLQEYIELLKYLKNEKIQASTSTDILARYKANMNP